MIVRPAQASDIAAIAELHAESWRTTYRGILRDEFLDGPVVQDRHRLWETRLSDAPGLDHPFVKLIEEGSTVKGFVCVFLDADSDWGALVDNLHVSAASQGQGLGRRLMSEAAGWVLRQRPQSRLHLWVYEKNIPACRFYERLGGAVTRREAKLAPDGSQVDILRYGWRELSGLAPGSGDSVG